MGKNSGFSFEISSKYVEFWRYNILITCECFDAEGKREEFVSVDDEIAPVGTNCDCCPKDYPSNRVVKFDTTPCHHLQVYIYVMPHSIPSGCNIEDKAPFDMDISVRHKDSFTEVLRLEVNSWSGGAFELSVNQNGVTVE
ncbi:MAG: hypothetical protein II307_06065 [Alistipes sp.]|nr:hypothetical protein [Alistipes sp.]